MTTTVTSADGTRIACDMTGAGPPVILVGGMFCTRATHRELADRLAEAGLCAVTIDRRGRGDSGDTPPYAVPREIEDLGAVIDAVGGEAALYGHSSGAGLVLEAAAAGLAVTRLIAHEPPYGDDDDDSRAASRQLSASVAAALAEDRRGDAIRLFLEPMGTPPEVLDAMASDPAMLAVAPTMPYDFAVMGDDERGGAVPAAMLGSISAPTLLLAGGASPPFFLEAATRVAELVPGASLEVLEGHDHGAPADAVAPVVARFVAG